MEIIMIRFLITALIGIFLFSNIAYAQQPSLHPTRPIRVVVPFAPGGASDLAARITAEGMGAVQTRNVTVENRSGGWIAVGGNFVREQPSDGHTLILIANGYTTSRQYVPDLTFDPREEFSVVSVLVRTPMAVMVPSNGQFNDARSLISAIQLQPDVHTFPSVGGGGVPAMVMHLFQRSINGTMVNVPYRGSAPAVSDFVAGRLSMMVDTVPLALPLNNNGARIVAVTSSERVASLPNVPTWREVGINDTFYNWQALFVKSDTPRPIREQLNAIIRQSLQTNEARRRFLGFGLEESDILSLDLTASERFVSEEVNKWRDIFGK
jgi:tripartite-type tricarboxylate transporter receptor subunit TctC